MKRYNLDMFLIGGMFSLKDISMLIFFPFFFLRYSPTRSIVESVKLGLLAFGR